MVKRKFNHCKAKKVTTSVNMTSGVELGTHWGELSFEEAQRREHINYVKKFGMDRRNW